jgi:hypothetical protein
MKINSIRFARHRVFTQPGPKAEYAAAVGNPVRATGPGIVTFAPTVDGADWRRIPLHS